MSTRPAVETMMLLEIRDLTKSYRRGARANDGISLSAGAGEVFGLLGHNGAGKTTLVNQIVGLRKPDAGTIRIDDRDVVADPALARRLCAFQPQAQVPINGLTPRQAIELIGRLRGAGAASVREQTKRFAAALDLGEWLDTDGSRLSGGVKRLISFCMAAVAPGRLVILDEPTNDVDPVRRRLLWAQIRALAGEGVAVLLVTHNVLEAERSVDRLAILDHGRVIADGTPAGLKAAVADDLRLELVLEPHAILEEVPAFVRNRAASGARVVASVATAHAGDAVNWADALRRAGRIEEFALAPATLEDVYIELVGRADALREDLAGPTEERDVHAA
jgi:ABC-2 type transport system ATP-binding protein